MRKLVNLRSVKNGDFMLKMILTRMSSGGLFKQGKTYTASAGKSPLSSVRSFVPAHQPEFKTVSPVFSSSSKIRSPREKSKNDDPSPEN